MTLLLDAGQLESRRAIAGSALAPLSASLLADLRKVMERPLYVPEEKALLSREGGRCPRDGTMLDFDPFSPREHRCPKCGGVYTGELHDRFWIYWYQLWLAERAVHGAVAGSVLGASEATTFALAVLDAFTDHYPKYPNVDNALGPTRPFFSTYLESIWLLQLCIAADLCDGRGATPVTSRFRDVVVEPSRALIESFDEGLSNRQVWNNAALLAANRLLGRDDAAESVVWADSGLVTHLTSALLVDGTWYEGENYHFFAHRGLWYCMELASRLDAEIPAELVRRYDAGFRAPFLTTLPDLTFPSRRDSQYAVSLRQWRFAEMCELGCARADDRILLGMLARLYGDDMSRGDTGRWKSTAEAERNIPATRLDRSDLGWKSLLFARPALSLVDPAPLPSVLLDAQGIGVIRRDAGRVYVALDYGLSGGGHGHPDRLNLMVSDGDRRILDDMGTGSYVDPSLHWYRSTLAHNAPMLDGRSQWRVDGELIAYEDRGAAGWMSARAQVAPEADAERTVVVMPGYLVDEVKWSASASRTFDLPLHVEITHEGMGDARPVGSDGSEDGFRFARDWRRIVDIPAGETRPFGAKAGRVWVAADAPMTVWSALVPGAPGQADRRMTLLRAQGSAGMIRWMWSWAGSPAPVALIPEPVIEVGAERHEHRRVEHGWQVAIHVAGSRSTIDLEADATVTLSAAKRTDHLRSDPFASLRPSASLPGKQRLDFTLGAAHYRRSEQTWEEAGSPTARVVVHPGAREVTLTVSVSAERSFVPRDVTNRLDNEQADINGAGLQLYIINSTRRAGYVIVPQGDTDALSIRPIDGWGSAIPVAGSWKPTPDGYEVDLRFRPDHALLLLDLLVNEKPAGRERRRGQLVLSGAEGEFIYLRGDRHEPNRLIPFRLIDD